MGVLTREQFVSRFRGPMLLFMTEAWAVRLVNRKELAETLEEHHVKLKALMNEMYDALVPPAPALVNGNGTHKAAAPLPSRTK